MNLVDYYRVLGLPPGASFAEVKASYRRLARVYHPDVNPGDIRAKDKFIQLTEAYQILLRNASSDGRATWNTFSPPTVPPSPAPVPTPAPSPPPKSRPKVNIPPLSPQDKSLKQHSYQQLRELLKTKRFPRAITLVEALRDRLPSDPEVRQWQAITYQSHGQYLLKQRQLQKAQRYLQKALRTDPHNRRLCVEIKNDLSRWGIELPSTHLN
ncbi:J domain-containing protein [Roseofilum casamattae]|uniref:DnaJ domain-containing protein n=1 Tax=Roseofilum casamattae BLCC-M143 TaxID=3022442 RepID=A0ABT7BVH9_9CYAN|nr:J domain-containing protein [Roseofilum casamattae]MDJ1183197.1 DnaJ domain-containing protein [Roseofilum casamattae BLCC-M143]